MDRFTILQDINALLRWEISAIPPGSRVLSASITLQVSNATAVPYPVYTLRRVWSERQANWTQAVSGTHWQPPARTTA